MVTNQSDTPDWTRLLESARTLPEQLDAPDNLVTELQEAKERIREIAKSVEDRASIVRSLRVKIADEFAGKPNDIPRSMSEVVAEIGKGFTEKQDIPISRSIKELNSLFQNKKGLLDQIGVTLESPVGEIDIKLDDLNKKINSPTLDEKRVNSIVNKVSKTFTKFSKHVESLATEPIENVIEEIESLKDSYMEEPFGELLEFFEEVEQLIEELETTGIDQIADITELVEQVLMAVDLVKSIPAP
ncbi:MAG: hypothetical protein AAF483_13845 [Planctomycetota bacterium]